MARTQTLVQLSDELLERLDALRASRGGGSRSELIRDALERYLAAESEAAIDRAIVEGYTRIPPDDPHHHEWAAIRAIREEPWPEAPGQRQRP